MFLRSVLLCLSLLSAACQYQNTLMPSWQQDTTLIYNGQAAALAQQSITPHLVAPGAELAETAESAAQRNIHLFTVGLGETKKALNIELTELKARDYVMVNDLVSFDFTLTGAGAEGTSVELVLREADSQTSRWPRKPCNSVKTTSAKRFA